MLWRHVLPAPTLGRRGERRAAWFYRLRGYSVVARNLRFARGEIDLIVRRGRTLVFVEVKTRQSLAAGAGYDAVGVRKQRQLITLAALWLARHPHPGAIRYDVVSLFWNGRRFAVTHFADAFRDDGQNARPRFRGL
jgi:putative endonuclease